MSSTSVGRLAAWSTFLAWIVAFAGFGETNELLTLLSPLLSIPLVYALLLAHRARSGNLAVAAGVAGIAGFVLQAVTTSNPDGPVWIAGAVAWGISILVFGYVQFSSTVVPKALAVIGIAAGVAQIAMAFVPADAAETSVIPPITLLTQLVWTLWLAFLFLRGKMVEA